MKIVIYVDYSNEKFNIDFNVSNKLIGNGHNVFLAVNDIQFTDLSGKCDCAYLGQSAISKKSTYPDTLILEDNII